MNDHSEDDTLKVMQDLAAQDSRVQVLDLKEQGLREQVEDLEPQTGIETPTKVAYKKAAIAEAIQEASGEIILTTDADCQMGPDWVTSMTACFSEDTGLVSGPVRLTGKTSFQQMQSLEFMGLIAIGAGSLSAGQPNLCNGANLAYRKAAFEEVAGFEGIDHIASGDDELLMHKITSQTNWQAKFCKDRSAIVRTPAQANWQAFRSQRLRWVSKSRHYQKKTITGIMVLAYLAVLGIPVLALAGFIDPLAWKALGLAFGLKVAGEFVILSLAAAFFNKLSLLTWYLPEQVAHVAYVLWVGIAGRRKTYSWKGRTVK